MKIAHKLMTGSLAFGLLISGLRAEEPTVPEIEPSKDEIILDDPVVEVPDDLEDPVFFEIINDVDPVIIVDDLVVEVPLEKDQKIVDSNDDFTKLPASEGEDETIQVSSAAVTAARLTGEAADTGKDDAIDTKKVRGSAPEKPASTEKEASRASAMVKNGRVFLTH
jgi:hypothetical protein